MHYPDRPKRGDPITAQSADRAADGITSSRIVGADRMVVSQSTTGVRLIAPSPMQMTLVILTTDWTRDGPPEWWVAEGEEAILHSDQIAYVKQPVRRVRVASPVAIGGAGTTVLAWWDTNSGWWLTIPSGDISPISGGDSGASGGSGDSGASGGSGDSGASGGSGDSGASGGSGDSGASGGSGDSGASGGSGADDVIVRCGDCLGRLCVTRDPYTGYITGIYYQTASGLVAVPECESGSGYDYDSGSGSGSGSGPPPPCAGLMSYTTSGTYTFMAPCDGTYIVECWGGGGGGKGGGDGMAGGGGGGGSYCRSVLTLTAGTYTVVVGAGGAGGTNGGAGGNGGHSSFGSGLVVAAGGLGAVTNGGAGSGLGNVGQVIHVGGSATSGFGHEWGGGGGGASGHPSGPGANGGISSPTSGGAGGSPATDGGAGGGGGDPYQHGLPGGWPGGGGGGGGSDDTAGTNGGAGAHGRVRITWPAT